MFQLFYFVGGEVPVPVQVSASQLKKQVQKLIDDGKLKLGEALEPKQFKRLVLRKGEIVEEIFTISGRKYPLYEIRERTWKEHEAQGLIRDHSQAHLEQLSKDDLIARLMAIGETIHSACDCHKDELIFLLKTYMTRRHFIVWQDHSTLANHGHLLLMIRIAYDQALFYTPAEIYELTGKHVDVQEVVETPEVYILARARDTILDKLSYIHTRAEDIKELSYHVKSSSGAEIKDLMRFFCGDHPELAFEKGQQEGGDYPCVGCGACAKRFYEIDYCYRQEYLSLEEHRKKV